MKVTDTAVLQFDTEEQRLEKVGNVWRDIDTSREYPSTMAARRSFISHVEGLQ